MGQQRRFRLGGEAQVFAVLGYGAAGEVYSVAGFQLGAELFVAQFGLLAGYCVEALKVHSFGAGQKHAYRGFHAPGHLYGLVGNQPVDDACVHFQILGQGFLRKRAAAARLTAGKVIRLHAY